MNIKDQQRFFDQKNHRFNDAKLLDPPYAQLLELLALEQSLKLKPASTIIDFGAGNGRVSLYFLKKGFNVIAVDISKHSLQTLQTIYNEHKRQSWGTLQTRTSLPPTRVDAIVGADILHHLAIRQLLPKIIKALKPTGRVVFSEPNAWHILWYIHYFFSKIPWHIERGILQCTYFNLKNAFQRSGLSRITLVGHGLLPTTPLSRFRSINAWNVRAGNYWPFKLFAFRYIVSGTNQSNF